MIIHANLSERGSGQRDEPERQHRHVQVDAETYEAGRDQITAEVPDGWIVAAWRVERDEVD